MARFDQELKPFAMEAATNELADEARREKENQEKKEKKETEKNAGSKSLQGPIRKNAIKKTDEKNKKMKSKNPDEKEDEQLEPPTEEKQEEFTLALPCSISFVAEKEKIEDSLGKLEAAEDEAIIKLNQLERSKEDMNKKKTDLDKTIQKLSSCAVKSNPVVKEKIRASKTERDKLIDAIPRAEVKIGKAKDRVKKVRADSKTAEKKLNEFKMLISKERAETAEDQPDVESEEGQSVVETVFGILDRSSCGTVNKRDFIKGLENATASSFLKLPTRIRQEDGSRVQMETVFQKICQGGDEFDLATFEQYMENLTCSQS